MRLLKLYKNCYLLFVWLYEKNFEQTPTELLSELRNLHENGLYGRDFRCSLTHFATEEKEADR